MARSTTAYFAENGRVYARTPDGVVEASTALSSDSHDLLRHSAAYHLAKAQREGFIDTHDLVTDPPANMLSRMARQTCRICGRAQIVRPDGSTYGSATENACVQPKEEE